LFEASAEPPEPYLATGFVQGQALASALREGPLPPEQAARIARDLALALGYAHSRGVVHRDVKPANVLLDDKGEPQLVDFGLAWRGGPAEVAGPVSEEEKQTRVLGGRLTQRGAVLGTPEYLAPEAFGEAEAGARPAADQYALGMTLYEMLTGRVAF